MSTENLIFITAMLQIQEFLISHNFLDTNANRRLLFLKQRIELPQGIPKLSILELVDSSLKKVFKKRFHSLNSNNSSFRNVVHAAHECQREDSVTVGSAAMSYAIKQLSLSNTSLAGKNSNGSKHNKTPSARVPTRHKRANTVGTSRVTSYSSLNFNFHKFTSFLEKKGLRRTQNSRNTPNVGNAESRQNSIENVQNVENVENADILENIDTTDNIDNNSRPPPPRRLDSAASLETTSPTPKTSTNTVTTFRMTRGHSHSPGTPNTPNTPNAASVHVPNTPPALSVGAGSSQGTQLSMKNDKSGSNLNFETSQNSRDHSSKPCHGEVEIRQKNVLFLGIFKKNFLKRV